MQVITDDIFVRVMTNQKIPIEIDEDCDRWVVQYDRFGLIEHIWYQPEAGHELRQHLQDNYEFCSYQSARRLKTGAGVTEAGRAVILAAEKYERESMGSRDTVADELDASVRELHFARKLHAESIGGKDNSQDVSSGDEREGEG